METFAIAEEKFKVIDELITRDNNLLNIRWLCEIAEVSESGFYNWRNSKGKREVKNIQDELDFTLILEAYNYRGYNKGSRSIHMRLLHNGTLMNRKKIQRLMRKFKLFCPIRKANPYRQMAKAMKTDVVAKNIIDRNFKQKPRYIILTDISYIPYTGNHKAYLSVMKDAYTNEVLAYVLSNSLEVDFVLETGELLMKKHGVELEVDAILHSDQGCHYTSIAFRTFLSSHNLTQSMSRRANCWDNAPQESFFGHMKDEIDLTECRSYEQVKTVIDDYMDYYNNERYQWDLEKLTPVQYYKYAMGGLHPITKKKKEPN